jgi:heat shock protein HslJ
VLVSLNGQEPLPGTQVTLRFEEQELGGEASCNDYGGSYTTTPDGGLTITELIQTEMACLEPEGVMEQEASYMGTLAVAASYQVAGERLEIRNAAGETVLVFESE